jgi:hypothetical protein
VVPLSCPPTGVLRASAIRSTTLISSLNAIEQAGKTAAYQKLLPQEHAQALRELVAGQWASIDIGMAHYGTVEQLGFTTLEARDNGRLVAKHVQNGYFATIVRTLGSGVTLWALLQRLPALLNRQVQGGGCAVYRMGPKDARIELHGIPIARFSYVRDGWAGMFEGTLELVVRKVYARDVTPPRTGDTVTSFTLSWV